jgi:hypothetical protein
MPVVVTVATDSLPDDQVTAWLDAVVGEIIAESVFVLLIPILALDGNILTPVTDTDPEFDDVLSLFESPQEMIMPADTIDITISILSAKRTGIFEAHIQPLFFNV